MEFHNVLANFFKEAQPGSHPFNMFWLPAKQVLETLHRFSTVDSLVSKFFDNPITVVLGGILNLFDKGSRFGCLVRGFEKVC